MFYVMCSTYRVCMFLCLLYAPIHQNKFQVGVNLLGNKYYSDSENKHYSGMMQQPQTRGMEVKNSNASFTNVHKEMRRYTRTLKLINYHTLKLTNHHTHSISLTQTHTHNQ